MQRFSYRWILVAVGALMGCVAVGSMFCLAVMLQRIVASTDWSRTGISSAMTLNFISMGVCGFLWGTASDRFGPRMVVLSGAVLLGAALVLGGQSSTLLEFQLSYGVLLGVATSAFFAPLISTVSGWFEERRALAISLVSAGMGAAPMTISPIAQWLAQTHDWRFAMTTIGVGAWCLLIPAACLVRRAPAAADEATAPGEARVDRKAIFDALGSRPFFFLAAMYFLCCATHSGPIFHTVSYATLCGIAPMAAVSIYSMEGLAGLGGRILFGLLGDRFGALPVLAAGLLAQAVVVVGYAFAATLSEFYIVAALFGAVYGGLMPLYASLARQYFGQRILGSVLGAASLLSSLGMALGPPLGGLIFDVLHQYKWLYLGSALLGLGAFVIAMNFPKPLQRQTASVAPA